MKKLFAVYLGGKAQGAQIEVHDLVFAVGPDIKSTFPQLRDVWFGTPESVHIDSWTELSQVDDYQITLCKEPSGQVGNKLFFINIGSYTARRLGENHHFLFLVAPSAQDAKARAKDFIVAKREDVPHTDNLIEIDSIKEISDVHGLYVSLEKKEQEANQSAEDCKDAITQIEFNKDLKITNLYWPLKQESSPSA